MAGELTLKSGWGKKNFLALVITAAVTLAVALPVLRMLASRAENGQLGLMTQVGVAIVVPIVIWLLYPQMRTLLGGEARQTLHWSLWDGVLTLGDAVIPQNTIKMVYCWKKNDSWTINIETTGKNYLLRALDEGTEKDRSIQRLYDLVDALGYRSQWKEV